MEANRNPCAACRFQKKKCQEDCILSAYFPAHKKEEYESVYRIFGLKNMTKILNEIKEKDDREKAVESFKWEAKMWEKNSIEGPFGEYKKLSLESATLKVQLTRLKSELRSTSDRESINNINGNASNLGYVNDNFSSESDYDRTPDDLHAIVDPELYQSQRKRVRRAGSYGGSPPAPLILSSPVVDEGIGQIINGFCNCNDSQLRPDQRGVQGIGRSNVVCPNSVNFNNNREGALQEQLGFGAQNHDISGHAAVQNGVCSQTSGFTQASCYDAQDVGHGRVLSEARHGFQKQYSETHNYGLQGKFFF